MGELCLEKVDSRILLQSKADHISQTPTSCRIWTSGQAHLGNPHSLMRPCHSEALSLTGEGASSQLFKAFWMLPE